MKVLVVEDDLFIGMLLQDMLEMLGHEVVGPCESIDGAMAQIDNCDAAVLDVNLGRNVTSLPVADALMERNVPFLFASGYGEEMEGYAPVAYLLKPYNSNHLEQALAKIA